MTMGDRIRELCKAAGWTQRELADRAGLSTSTISKLEKDRTSPRVETVEDLATTLDCATAHLLYGPALSFWARLLNRRPVLQKPQGMVAKTIDVPQAADSETEGLPDA